MQVNDDVIGPFWMLYTGSCNGTVRWVRDDKSKRVDCSEAPYLGRRGLTLQGAVVGEEPAAEEPAEREERDQLLRVGWRSRNQIKNPQA